MAEIPYKSKFKKLGRCLITSHKIVYPLGNMINKLTKNGKMAALHALQQKAHVCMYWCSMITVNCLIDVTLF